MSAAPERARVCRCERPLLDAETCLRCGRPPILLPVLSHPPARRRATWTRPGVVRAISTFAFFRGRAPVPADWNKRMVDWPALDRASRLILDRADELNGDHYEVLTPAADALEARYPLAATIIRRAMIDFALINARSKRYPHAARHLVECARLAARINDYGSYSNHEVYRQQLLSTHGRKTAFWGS